MTGKRYFLTDIKKVLILVHRKELLKQAYNSLGERCFKIEGGIKKIPNNYDYDVLKWYDMAIKKTILLIEQIDDDRNKVVFSTNAKKMWIDKFNQISNKQNSENENEYLS